MIFFLGKGPLSDHSQNSFEGHFVHVGGTDMIIDESSNTQPKIARIVSSRFLPPNDTDVEPDQCGIVFYYYNLGIPSDVGMVKLIIVYVYCNVLRKICLISTYKKWIAYLDT